jgi:putative alpha-1,2-mannosidase
MPGTAGGGLGQPWKTQEVVRAAMQTYNSRPDGLPGNDDTGTMSAWYVLAAIGIYGATPGVPVYELTTPAFSSVSIHLGAAQRTFTTSTISAPGASTAKKYAQSVSLDGRAFGRTFLTQCDLHAGGRLSWTVGSTASAWGTHTGEAPPSLSDSAA